MSNIFASTLGHRAIAAAVVMLMCSVAIAQTLSPIAKPEGNAGPATAASTPAGATKLLFDWREQYAYAEAVQAFLYLYPWVYFPAARWDRTTTANHQANQFAHIRDLETAARPFGSAANNDTMYSRAWLYVKDEPVIISVPEIKDRYYALEFADFMGDNIDYVGARTTGTKAGHYAVVSADWRGKLPAGVKALHASSTPWVILQGRTFVNGDADVPAVRAIQDQYKITPLSQWGKPNGRRPVYPEIWQPLSLAADPLAVWKTINRALSEVPPPARDVEFVQSFSRIGLGAGRDIETLPESTKRALVRAAADGQRIVAEGIFSGYLQKNVNGWNYPPPAIGRPTATRDWLFRAMQAFGGYIANDPEEGMYLNVGQDAEGKPLLGSNRYTVRFEPNELPKVKAFWSITMYNAAFKLVDNPLNRYQVGDRSGLKPDADGGTTIYLQKNSPGADKESNWLPTPDGRFLMFLRAYLPGDDLLKQTWQPPRITRVNEVVAERL